MKRVLIIVGGALGALVCLLLAAVVSLYAIGNSRMNNAPEVAVVVVEPATDPDSLARGEHIFNDVSGCRDCHGANLGGGIFIDEPGFATIAAPNLTTGAGGVGSAMTPEAWAAAIRHGVGHDGRALVGMPANAFQHMSDADLAAVISYIQSAPPVDSDWPARSTALPATIIFGVLGFDTSFPVAFIDHDTVGGDGPPEGVTVAYGEYLTQIGGCHDCHGPDLGGRTAEEAENGPPAGPNLRQSGELNGWSEADFMTAIREGRTPAGAELSEEMPWMTYQGMTDTELMAIWAYLETLE